MKHLLIISYFFPPLGGPGVQRAQKFVKYLPEFGWEPIVLTVKKVEYIAYDESLLKEIPDTEIYRTETLDPMRLLYFGEKLRKNGYMKQPIPVLKIWSEVFSLSIQKSDGYLLH